MEELKAGDPTTLGSYRMLGRLGSGGLSVVFLAESTAGGDAGSSRFAVKVLRPHLADEQRFRNRLAREAARIMSVAGRHTARVHEIANEGPFVYIVMDYVEGETLERLVSNGRRIQGPLLWFMAAGLVDAVREIHAAGIVHRDVKPSNVLIGPDGIVVTDFGFGGILDEGGFARTGTLMGSVAWLSPEQITGTAVDARTDIFNLGLVLAFIALGRHPYSTATGEADSQAPLGSGRPEAMMYRISHSQPNIDGVPSPMREMVARCLAVDPAQRPSLGELTSFFASGGSTASTQPIPRIEPATAAAVGSAHEGSISADDTPPTPPPVEAIRVRREDTGASMISDPMREYPDDFTPEELSYGQDQLVRRRRRTAILVSVAAVLGLVAVAGVVDATNVVDIGLIGTAEPAVTTTTSTTTTSTTTTTVVPTTTVPPPPVYKLYEVAGNKYRWNPCQNPIKILLNPTGKLTPGQQASLEAFLTQQATELSQLTGMTIVYDGLTEEISGRGYAYGEEVLIHIDVPGGDGLLQDDKPFEGSISGDRIKNGFREIDAVNFHYNANALQYLFLGDELHPYGQWLVMLMLGNSLGLNPLSDADMTAGGSNDPEGWEKEIMYFGGKHQETPVWGPGDIKGLAEVGASAGCF